MNPTVRVSILTIPEGHIDEAAEAMRKAEQDLKGILALKGLRGVTDNLHDRVLLRLRWDKILADTPIEVAVTGREVELKGTVKNAEQRARATELAESNLANGTCG